MSFFSSIKRLWTKDEKIESKPIAVSEIKIDDNNLSQSLGPMLRQSEPKLSKWLELTLHGLDQVGDPLWVRLHFLLLSLEAPEAEASAFVEDFKTWAERMEYNYIADFRSELQYRLALALDMEDEDDEKDRILLSLNTGLAQTRARLGQGLQIIFSTHSDLGSKFWEDLEELFIRSDIGIESTLELISRLKKRVGIDGAKTPEEFMPILEGEFIEVFKTPRKISVTNPPEVLLVIGVNGVGKTTTIAKLAYRAKMQGKKVLLIAADTFRAAAVEQLGIWAKRTGADFFSKGQGIEPAAVAWEGMDKVLASNYDLVIVDTAGRLHTKVNLMDELKKVREIITRKISGAPHRTVLIVDATTGQNAMSQAKMFKEQCEVDEIILTKLDGTSKGGMAIAIALQLSIPISYMGLGEKMEDLRPFNGQDFAKAILDFKNKE